MFIWPLGCGMSPVVRELGLLYDPTCVGAGVGGSGVAVGKYVAVGASGWNGVAVAVAFTGLYRKSGFMLTAAGDVSGGMGKLQAEIKPSNTRKTRAILVFMWSLSGL